MLHSSFAHCDNHGRQIGHMILLEHDTKNVSRLYFCSYRCKIIVEFFLTDETYAFAESFGVAFMLMFEIKSNMSYNISVIMLKD